MIPRYESQYKALLWECLSKGVNRKDRTGVGSRSIFNAYLKIDLKECFPLLTGRKMFQKTTPTQILKFLDEDTSLSEDFRIQSKLPIIHFIKAGLSRILRLI